MNRNLSRRTFLRNASGVTVGVAAVSAGMLPTGTATTNASGLPRVEPLDASAVSLADFSGLEQQVAPYLGLLADLANSVEDEDPQTFGFINCGCWRQPADVPDNARVQENCLTLAYFYSVERPWNPYYGDDALRQRLEAALQYWVVLQNDDGSFPQAFPGGDVERHDRAATAFALEFVGLRTPEVLDSGPGVTPEVYDSVVAAARRATEWFLTADEVWGEEGSLFANQVMAGMVAISGMLDRLGDPALTQQFRQRAAEMETIQQGSAGFYRDGGAVAHLYGIAVQSRDMALWADPQTRTIIDRMERRYLDWLQYNALYDRGVEGFFLNNAIDNRHPRVHSFVTQKVGANNLWTERIDLAAAFSTTAEDIAEGRDQWWNSTWDQAVAPLMPGVYQRMTAAVVRDMVVGEEHYPSADARDAARNSLRPLEAPVFTEFRRDDVAGQEFLFAKRPPVLLGLSFGRHNPTNTNARFGLNYLWHEGMGMIVQSQGGGAPGDPADHAPELRLAWGTARNAAGRFQTDAFDEPSARYYVGHREVDAADIGPRQAFRVEYAPRESRWVDKSIAVTGPRVAVDARAEGEFWEQVPLILAPGDDIRWLGAHGNDEIRFGEGVTGVRALGISVQRTGSGLPAASGGAYVDTPTDGPAGEGQVTFQITVDQPGEYALWGRVHGPDSSSDSFIVRVDGGDPIHWHMGISASWMWKRVTRGTEQEGVTFTLGAGSHTVTMQTREPGARLDVLLLTRDLQATPPDTGLDEGIVLEAEDGDITAPMRVVTDEPSDDDSDASGRIQIIWGSRHEADIAAANITMLGARRLHLLKIHAAEHLRYHIIAPDKDHTPQ